MTAREPRAARVLIVPGLQLLMHRVERSQRLDPAHPLELSFGV